MKNKINLFILLFVFGFSFSQTKKIDYKYEMKNTLSVVDHYYSSPATLLFNNNQKLYTVEFNMENQKSANNGNAITVPAKGPSYYKIFSNPSGGYLIIDKINQDQYYFTDNYEPMSYKILNENKVVNNKKLTKATTNFRGRNYIVWFDPNTKTKEGPWKFNNLQGIAYEIYDENKLFKWTLEKIENSKVKIENPFVGETVFKNYVEYPKMRYGLSPLLQEDLKKAGIKMTELERNGLEILFEWEK